MSDFVTAGEFKQLATRVEILEREVEGEKLVSRHILQQTRRNGDDLAAIKTRMDRVENEITGLRSEVGGLRGEVGGLRGPGSGLAPNLPKIIADAIRDVLGKSDHKP